MLWLAFALALLAALLAWQLRDISIESACPTRRLTVRMCTPSSLGLLLDGLLHGPRSTATTRVEVTDTSSGRTWTLYRHPAAFLADWVEPIAVVWNEPGTAFSCAYQSHDPDWLRLLSFVASGSPLSFTELKDDDLVASMWLRDARGAGARRTSALRIIGQLGRIGRIIPVRRMQAHTEGMPLGEWATGPAELHVAADEPYAHVAGETGYGEAPACQATFGWDGSGLYVRASTHYATSVRDAAAHSGRPPISAWLAFGALMDRRGAVRNPSGPVVLLNQVAAAPVASTGHTRGGYRPAPGISYFVRTEAPLPGDVVPRPVITTGAARIPWKALGLAAPPAAGATLEFSMMLDSRADGKGLTITWPGDAFGRGGDRHAGTLLLVE